MSEIRELQKLIADFSKERDWEKFHTPKNLALALASEVGELLAEFRWKTDNDFQTVDQEHQEKISLEIADVAIFLFRLAQVLQIDIAQSVKDKLLLNTQRPLNGADFRKD